MTVPLMFFLTGFIIPLPLNRVVKVPWFSAAIGQFIAIRRNVFDAIGGCEAFKKKTSEDMYMARLIKKKGFKTLFLNLSDHVKCQMYSDYRCAIAGIGKNIFDFLGKNTLLTFFLMIVIFFFLLLPFPLLFYCIAVSSAWTLHILAIVTLYTLAWIFIFLGMRLNWWYGFFWPVFYTNLLYMGVWSWFRTISGKGFIWKDRKVS